jgi:hypothetical protein
MATRITTLLPPCAYNSGGIPSVRVLDWEDFISFGFAALYDSCLITEVQRSGEFADVQAKVAKYTGPLSGKIINHSLETFVESLAADYTAQVILASRRRYIVIFDGYDGKSYAFGYEAGATPVFTGQTDGAQGYVITFTAASSYPLFEVAPEALLATSPTSLWIPDFNNGAYCEIA